MKIYKLKSYAKINLTLNIIDKLRNDRRHRIESIISFIDLADIIEISENKLNKHSITFCGKFYRGIPKNNSISRVLDLLDQSKYLGQKKYNIKITKNIPQKSGMGGGSMNAATILNFFLKKKVISLKEAKNFSKEIGSDVILGLNKKPKILYSDSSIRELKKKIIFHVILIKPKFGCSTIKVYSKNKIFTKRQYYKNKFFKVDKKFLLESKNDLENSAFKIYPKLNNLKNIVLSQKKGDFVRMTGSGSTIVVYFSSEASAKNAFKIYKRKLNNKWCILSKII